MKSPFIVSLIFLSMLIFSCKSKTSSNRTMTDITGKTWKLVEINGSPLSLKHKKNTPYFSLNRTEKRYSGHGGCNGISGTFEISPKSNTIKFNQGISTMIACEDLETEKQFTDALLQADNYSVEGNTLSINKAKMAPLAKFTLQK